MRIFRSSIQTRIGRKSIRGVRVAFACGRLPWVYKITYKKSVKKELGAVPDAEFLKIDKEILSLKNQPFPYPQSKNLKGEDRYRLRIGNYRVIYTVDEKHNTVTIYRIRHRKEVYRQQFEEGRWSRVRGGTFPASHPAPCALHRYLRFPCPRR